MALMLMSLAWALGIITATRLAPELYWWLICLVPVPALFVTRLRQPALLSCLALLLFCSGSFFQQHQAAGHQRSAVSAFNDSYVKLMGTIVVQPEERDQNTRLRVETQQIRLDGIWQATSGALAVYTERYPRFEYGDTLEISGRLETPAGFDDFDYAAYLARHDVYSVMFRPQIQLTGSDHSRDIQTFIIAIRTRLGAALATILPEPSASLAQGLLLGMRSAIPPQIGEQFNTAGIAHILAISGMHIAIVTGILTATFQRLFGKRHYLYVWLALIMLWLYAFVAGASPSVIRAALMASIYLLAELTGRQKNVGPALLLAVAIMLTANPQVMYEASFQLSVLAMLGLIYIFPLLRPWGDSITNWLKEKLHFPLALSRVVMDGFWLSVAASLAVWPVTAWHFGKVSMLAPVTSALAVPALPPVIMLAAAAALGSLIFWPVGQFIGWFAWLGLNYLLASAKFFAGFRWASIDSIPASAALICIYYVLLCSVLVGSRYIRSLRQRRPAGPII